MDSPLPWYGGKARYADWIVAQFPAHHTYVEPFAGGLSVLFAKPPSPLEVVNDVNSGLVTFWRVVRDPALFPALQTRLTLTPYSREEFTWARDTWAAVADPVEQAARWYTMVRQAFSGKMGEGTSWSFQVSAHRSALGAWKWMRSVDDRLPAIHARLRLVQVEHGDWSRVVETYDTPDTLFYCDPPYVLDTRSGGAMYPDELSDADHQALVARLLGVQGAVVVSGYDAPVYAPWVDAGWTVIRRRAHAYAVGRTRAAGVRGAGSAMEHTREEVLWMNPHARRSAQLTLF